MKKTKLLIFCILSELLIIIAIAAATMFEGILFGLFYNVLYGLILSTLAPLFLLFKSGENFSSVGVKKFSLRPFVVLIFFICFSIGGQLLPKMIIGEYITWQVLPIAILPLIMTTFFEEFLFRGFLQTRLEKHFGWGIAILISAIMFSVYHLGYPGFRNWADTLLLFAVGLGFAIAYKLSGNNLMVSYFVNLPNAFVTYLLKTEQFPTFTAESNMYAAITIIAIIIILYASNKKMKKASS